MYPHLTDCRDKNGVIGEYVAAQEPRIVESGALKAIMNKSARNTKFDKVENMKEQGLQFGVKATKKTLPLSAIVVPESTKIDAGSLKSR